MANRRARKAKDPLQAVELASGFTWEALQLRLRTTNRKIRKLLAMKVKPRAGRKSRSRAGTSRRRDRRPARVVA